MQNHRVAITSVVLTALIALGVLLRPGGLELRVVPVDGGPPLAVLPLFAGEPFTLQYYHSVENAPIWEVHTLDPSGSIFIEEERYLKFGAGMGKMPGVGRMVRQGPYESIVDMHMRTGNFVLRIGSPGVDHMLLWRGTQTNLSTLAPHAAVQFCGRSISRFYALWRQVFPHRATPPGIADGHQTPST
ncbi:DUF1850 domain-containing protein [Desulfosarcina ovata]|nr:DUF1850 domain-containing protein [Desulfosarcina ovata]